MDRTIFYQDTLLDNITSDLIPIIDNYYQIESRPFCVIGKFQVSYPGYRIVLENDMKCSEFGKLFVDFHTKMEGVPSIDNFKGQNLFCGDSMITFMRLNERGMVTFYYLQCERLSKIRMNEIIPFEFTYKKYYIDMKYLSSSSVSLLADLTIPRKISLYVRSDY